MEDQYPTTIFSATSIVRNHSPYCEATGPIVREGFVAARVRAIQEKYDRIQQMVSHSPMKPCPMPPRLRIADPSHSPKPALASGFSKANRGHDASNESANPLSHSYELEESPMKDTMSTDTVDFTADRNPLIIIDPDEETISSPQAIPLNLANLSQNWVLSNNQKDHNHHSIESLPTLHARRSVADKLGSLVDHGWVGFDIFGKSISARGSSGSNSPSHISGKKAKSRSQLQSVGSHEEVLQLPRRIYYAEEIDTPKDNEGSIEKGVSIREESVPGLVRFGDQQKQGHGVGLDRNAKLYSNVIISEVHEREAHDVEAHCSANELRALALHHPECSTGCQNPQIELQKLSSAQEIDRHVSEWEHASTKDDTRLGVRQNTAGCLQVIDPKESPDLVSCSVQANRPSPEPSAESSRLSSATTQQLKQSVSRSSLWVSKLAGFKLVLVDRKPIIRDLSRRTSEPAMNTERLQYQRKEQQQQPLCPIHPARPIENLPEVQEDIEAEKSDTIDTSRSECSSRPRTPNSAHTIQEQLTDSPELIQWETTGRGRGIKRVQVIVSLDGVDDLIVEAKLLRKE